MVPLALALQLAVASPGLAGPALPPTSLAPRLDPGPFGGGELLLASVGALGGDLLVVGGAYVALQLFANGTISPTASNFRTAAYVLGVSALVVPPLAAVLLARLGARGPASGRLWKALLLASAGQAAALAAGYYGAPHFWLILPVQLATVTVGTSFGLHWGPRPLPGPGMVPPAVRREAPDPAGSTTTASLTFPVCPDA